MIEAKIGYELAAWRPRLKAVLACREHACAQNGRLDGGMYEMRQSTQEELSDWLDNLAVQKGTGLRHEVTGGMLHAYNEIVKIVNGVEQPPVRIEVY